MDTIAFGDPRDAEFAGVKAKAKELFALAMDSSAASPWLQSEERRTNAASLGMCMLVQVAIDELPDETAGPVVIYVTASTFAGAMQMYPRNMRKFAMEQFRRMVRHTEKAADQREPKAAPHAI